MLESAIAPEGTVLEYFDHGTNRNDYQRSTVSKWRGSHPDQFQSEGRNDFSNGASLGAGGFYLALSRVRSPSDKFPERGRDFHLDRSIEEMDRAFEGLQEF
jgi:hypothetical protein